MKIEKDKTEQIINFGVFEYDTEKMASILDVSRNIIQHEMEDVNSQFYKLYQKGKDLADYVIDLKLFEMAKNGDIKALDKFDSRKNMRRH